jgi:hypothetical protein
MIEPKKKTHLIQSYVAFTYPLYTHKFFAIDVMSCIMPLMSSFDVF